MAPPALPRAAFGAHPTHRRDSETAQFRHPLLALVVVFASLLALSAHTQSPADVLIRHATIVDVEHARLIADQAVVTSGTAILAVGPDAEIAQAWRASKTLDAGKRFLIPGLWDMHVHFGGGVNLIEENKAMLPLYVAHGITTIRDASGDLPEQVLAWPREIASGAPLGPTLLSSGPKIEGIKPVWKGTLETGSQADVNAAIAKLKALDVDFVKITDSTLEPELFLYAVRKARAAGLRTSGHIPMGISVRQAVEAGLSSIEHMDYAVRAGVKDEPAIVAAFAAGSIDRAAAASRLDSGFDPATAKSAYEFFAQQGIAVTPTLNGSRILAWLDRDTHENDAYLAYIGPKLRATYDWRVQRAAQADAAAIAARHARFDRSASVLKMLQQAGVSIMAGTDAGFLNSFNYPGIGLHDELSLFVANGLTPPQALSSATRAGPGWFGKLGSVRCNRPGQGSGHGVARSQSAGRYRSDTHDSRCGPATDGSRSRSTGRNAESSPRAGGSVECAGEGPELSSPSDGLSVLPQPSIANE